jgi:hypothetical protein
MNQTFLLSDVGSDAIGQTKTFVQLTDNVRPKGSYTLTVYTQYNKARDPNGKQVKLALTIPDKNALKDLALFLATADSGSPVTD